MKYQKFTLKLPIKVFQVFRHINVYDKTKKSYNDRKDTIGLTDIPSKSGYVFKDELYLPESILNNPDLQTCDLVTLEDDFCPMPQSVANRCFHLKRKCIFDIFEIKSKEVIELHLQYKYFGVGTPERENFKLGEIKKGKPIEIKINGKTDFSLTSRRARVFKEQTYIFNYIGDFRECKILKEPFDFTMKRLPPDRKVVDLIKPLW